MSKIYNRDRYMHRKNYTSYNRETNKTYLKFLGGIFMYKVNFRTHLNALSCVLHRVKTENYKCFPVDQDGTLAMELSTVNQKLLTESISELERFCWGLKEGVA